jgi:hypothetical protein
MMIDEFNIQTSMPLASDVRLPEAPKTFAALEPHRTVRLDGVLCCGRSLPRRRNEIAGLALRPLTHLDRQAVD